MEAYVRKLRALRERAQKAKADTTPFGSRSAHDNEVLDMIVDLADLTSYALEKIVEDAQQPK